MKIRLGLLAGMFGAALLASAPAHATVITAAPVGSTVYSLGTANLFGAGPDTVAPGITWSSTNASHQGGAVYGYTGGYGFSGNGGWDAALGGMAGLNDSFDAFGVSDSMTFSFATPVQAVGGFINYVPGNDTPTTIAAYNSLNQLLGTFNVTFLTGGGTDSGQFLGFQDATPDISFFKLTDNYIGITQFTVLGQATTSAVPEPLTLSLFGAGLVGAAALRRRKKA